MPKNRQYYKKAKYPDKVAKPKSLVFVRIFLFRSAGSKIQYFPTAPLNIYFAVIKFFAVKYSAQSNAPPAAPLKVLCESPINL